jgi:hypothetical protein
LEKEYLDINCCGRWEKNVRQLTGRFIRSGIKVGRGDMLFNRNRLKNSIQDNWDPFSVEYVGVNCVRMRDKGTL